MIAPDCRRVIRRDAPGIDSGLFRVDVPLLVILVVTLGNSPSSTTVLHCWKRLGLGFGVLVLSLSKTEILSGTVLVQLHSDNTARMSLEQGH